MVWSKVVQLLLLSLTALLLSFAVPCLFAAPDHFAGTGTPHHFSEASCSKGAGLSEQQQILHFLLL
jgi:hypothetical protein